MKAIIISMPRAGGTALARMMGGSGDDDGKALRRAIKDGGELPGGDIVRLTVFGHRTTADAMRCWSWLLRKLPGVPVILLKREADAAFEMSLTAGSTRVIPAFGKCWGCCYSRARRMLADMEAFHEMNPSRTILLDHSEMADHPALCSVLGAMAPSAAEWQRLANERPHSAESEWATWPDTSKSADPGIDDDPFADDDPFRMRDSPRWQEESDLLEAPQHPEVDPDKRARKKPRPFIEAWPEAERAIVYPWLSTAAVWEELRYSLRSLHAHFADKECPIYILGDAPPPWLKPGSRVIWRAIQGYAPDWTGGQINRREGMWQAQVTGVQLAERVMWMNDDIHLLRATGWEDLETALTEGRLDGHAGRLLGSANIWKKGLGAAVADLMEARLGEPVMRFATHTPFLFEREKSIEVLRRYHLAYKGSWVTLYHNHHRTPHEPCGPHKARYLPEFHGERYLNYNNHKLTDELKAEISERWPDPAPWEQPLPVAPARPHLATVSTLWIGETLTPLAKLTLKAWLDHGHPVRLYTFRPVARIPHGVEVRDAALIAPPPTSGEDVRIYSDRWRFELLANHGGTWVDADCVPVRPLPELGNGPLFFRETMKWRNGLFAGLIHAPEPGHPSMVALHDFYRNTLHPDWYAFCGRFRGHLNGEPGRFTPLANPAAKDGPTLPTAALYDGSVRLKDYADSWTLHLIGSYESSWNRSNMKKRSLIGDLVERHFPDARSIREW